MKVAAPLSIDEATNYSPPSSKAARAAIAALLLCAVLGVARATQLQEPPATEAAAVLIPFLSDEEREEQAAARALAERRQKMIDDCEQNFGTDCEREVEDSLARLRTHYIDIYQVHWPDPLVPMEETASAMAELYKQGKIRAIGVSNFSVAQMEAFRQVAPLHVLQSPYNLFERGIEDGILPYCRRNNIAVLGYGALCRGLLSGRMRRDTTFSSDDLRKNDPKFQEPRFDQYLRAVQRLDLLAQYRYGKRVIHLAVRWMLDQGVTAALWGARHPGQLAPVADVGGWSLEADVKAEIDRVLRERITDPVGPEFMAPPSRPAIHLKETQR